MSEKPLSPGLRDTCWLDHPHTGRALDEASLCFCTILATTIHGQKAKGACRSARAKLHFWKDLHWAKLHFWKATEDVIRAFWTLKTCNFFRKNWWLHRKSGIQDLHIFLFSTSGLYIITLSSWDCHHLCLPLIRILTQVRRTYFVRTSPVQYSDCLKRCFFISSSFLLKPFS